MSKKNQYCPSSSIWSNCQIYFNIKSIPIRSLCLWTVFDGLLSINFYSIFIISSKFIMWRKNYRCIWKNLDKFDEFASEFDWYLLPWVKIKMVTTILCACICMCLCDCYQIAYFWHVFFTLNFNQNTFLTNKHKYIANQNRTNFNLIFIWQMFALAISARRYFVRRVQLKKNKTRNVKTAHTPDQTLRSDKLRHTEKTIKKHRHTHKTHI